MTTELEADVLPDVYDLVKETGTLASFVVDLSPTVDTDESTVTPGAPVTYQRYITPPTNLEIELDEDGTEREGVRFFLPSGALTSDPLPFTPTVGMHCTVRSKDYFVRLVEPKPSGDLLAGYFMEARR